MLTRQKKQGDILLRGVDDRSGFITTDRTVPNTGLSAITATFLTRGVSSPEGANGNNDLIYNTHGERDLCVDVCCETSSAKTLR